MNKFSWYDANTVEEALMQMDTTVSEVITKGTVTGAVAKSGGIDILDLMKEGLMQPVKVVNIKNIKGLNAISYDKKAGLRIGANATLAEIEGNTEVKQRYTALYQALSVAANPHLRNMSTLGGNLAQRTRCWYFRSIDHKCFRKSGNMCFAKLGENEFHAVMRNGSCCSVHASSIATPLMAFNARVEITGEKGVKREISMEEFFVEPAEDIARENILKANELITAVIIPPLSDKVKSVYVKHGMRDSTEWAIGDVAIVAEVSGTKCKNAEVVLGAAAPIPLKVKESADILNTSGISEDSAKAAGEASMQKATPLGKNKYKVPMFKAIVKRAVLQLV